MTPSAARDSRESKAHACAAPHTQRPWKTPFSIPFVAIIWLYRVTLSWALGRHCRFYPTCSQYGLDAYRTHSTLRATTLTASRILRCNPFCKGGYDPVPVPDDVPPHAPDPSAPNPDRTARIRGIDGSDVGTR